MTASCQRCAEPYTAVQGGRRQDPEDGRISGMPPADGCTPRSDGRGGPKSHSSFHGFSPSPAGPVVRSRHAGTALPVGGTRRGSGVAASGARARRQYPDGRRSCPLGHAGRSYHLMERACIVVSLTSLRGSISVKNATGRGTALPVQDRWLSAGHIRKAASYPLAGHSPNVPRLRIRISDPVAQDVLPAISGP
jgi:hypothetical protein